MLVAAGVMADSTDDAPYGEKKAQTNELTNMLNVQYIWGTFEKGRDGVVA